MLEVIKRLIKSVIGWTVEIFGDTSPGRFFLELTLGVAIEKNR